MFLLGSGSRRRFERECDDDSGGFLRNFNLLADTDEESIPHNDTVADYLTKLPAEELAKLPARLLDQLIRSRVLESARLLDRYYPVAIDATGIGSFRRRHCPHCLTLTTKEGKTVYYHLVLEAKLVTPGGLALSIASEFLENRDPEATKQDCELAAFPRLARKLKEAFPRLPICLLLDGLYANQNVFTLCRLLGWEWIISFKDGVLPTPFDEFQRLALLAPENVRELDWDKRYQRLRWIPDLEHEGHRFTAFDCLTHAPEHGPQYFAWITSLPVTGENLAVLANQGGRCRWIIENQGFNIQKNHGYALEHVYCRHPNAMKNYYVLLQIAHLFHQLLLRGKLLQSFRRRLKTLGTFFSRLGESLRNVLIAAAAICAEAVGAMQIRLALHLDSS